MSEQVFTQLFEPRDKNNNRNGCRNRTTLFLYLSYPKQQETFDALIHLRAREHDATYSIGAFNADLSRKENTFGNISVRKVEEKLIRRLSSNLSPSNDKCKFDENFDIESSCGDQAVYYYDKPSQLCKKSCLTSENKHFRSLNECNSACNNIIYHSSDFFIFFYFYFS